MRPIFDQCDRFFSRNYENQPTQPDEKVNDSTKPDKEWTDWKAQAPDKISAWNLLDTKKSPSKTNSKTYNDWPNTFKYPDRNWSDSPIKDYQPVQESQSLQENYMTGTDDKKYQHYTYSQKDNNDNVNAW